jgi:hypothetical protein
MLSACLPVSWWQQFSGTGKAYGWPNSCNKRPQVYCEKECTGPFRKRRGMLTCGVVFLHDNVRPHEAARPRALPEHFKWELLHHPPYNPDFATRDYHLFTRIYLKNWLRSQRRRVDGWCHNVAEVTGGRLHWHRHTKTYSPIQVPQFRPWLRWEAA